VQRLVYLQRSTKMKNVKAMRFKLLQHGIYLDTETKLLWHPEQPCIDSHSAIKYAASLDTAGMEWRVPTRRELLTICDYTLYRPATELPDMNQSSYWSSSTYADNTAALWIVYFGDGGSGGGYCALSFYVRCVAGPVEDSVIRELEEM
jgi:hypothetical protein